MGAAGGRGTGRRRLMRRRILRQLRQTKAQTRRLHRQVAKPIPTPTEKNLISFQLFVHMKCGVYCGEGFVHKNLPTRAGIPTPSTRARSLCPVWAAGGMGGGTVGCGPQSSGWLGATNMVQDPGRNPPSQQKLPSTSWLQYKNLL